MDHSLAHLLFTNFLLSTPKTRGSTSSHWRPKEVSWRRPRGDPEAAEGAMRRRLRATQRRLRARESDMETVDGGWGRLIRSGLITQCTAVLQVIGNENTHGWETTFSMANATCGVRVDIDGQAYLRGGGIENETKGNIAAKEPRGREGQRRHEEAKRHIVATRQERCSDYRSRRVNEREDPQAGKRQRHRQGQRTGDGVGGGGSEVFHRLFLVFVRGGSWVAEGQRRGRAAQKRCQML
ncbi:hypothetical protein DFH08DRAFT_822123 [Mycena albidolilacea]|uniref:Uncharacterized protein n=1 Tax=Mycena albidolilacea TaxID=1033008 RepID=A0AAD6Z8E3_9AGAR|nr:hypothetical protein DFH08DRAFT_822123 [Mycena albidolilacea]